MYLVKFIYVVEKARLTKVFIYHVPEEVYDR